MPQKIPDTELDRIATIIHGHPEGIRITAIEKELAGKMDRPVPRRALQRRFVKLPAENRARIANAPIWRIK